MSEQRTFSVPLAAYAARAKASLDAVGRHATLDLFTAVVQRSPVDTGRFRANWNVSAGAPNFVTTDSTEQARGLAQAQQALVMPLGGVTYLANGLPYAYRLEVGHSKQAPAGMVKLSAQEFDDFVRRAIAS